jgi:glyoxylase-like metal-dependent hydrolase (beta-lactamase superfamily II)
MEFESLPVTRFEQNCSLLWCTTTRRAAVVDPGGDLPELRQLLDLEGLTLEVVLLTHGHVDHAGGAAELARVTGARIEGPHSGDAHLLQSLEGIGQRFGIGAQNCMPDRWLEEGDEVRFGSETMQVLHCPGHTRGHVAYFHPLARAAFVGDILFRGAIGAWQHADGNLPQLLHSIRSKLFALGDDVRFVPGHGEMSTFGYERRANPFVGEQAIAAWRARQGAAETKD